MTQNTYDDDPYTSEQERMDDDRSTYGDPRRCPRHGCRISSDNGLFDAPCPMCENEMWRDAQDEM